MKTLCATFCNNVISFSWTETVAVTLMCTDLVHNQKGTQCSNHPDKQQLPKKFSITLPKTLRYNYATRNMQKDELPFEAHAGKKVV